MVAGLGVQFLSCLFGSEVGHPNLTAPAYFLSCLFGSEEENNEIPESLIFLSCLFGSEGICTL